jgi:hypothetical protein
VVEVVLFYDYNNLARINYETSPQTTQTQQFTYDELDSLLTASATGGNNGTYSDAYDYDEIGNMYRPSYWTLDNFDAPRAFAVEGLLSIFIEKVSKRPTVRPEFPS